MLHYQKECKRYASYEGVLYVGQKWHEKRGKTYLAHSLR